MNVMKDEWGGIVHGEMNRYRRMNLFAHEQEHATLAWSNKWYDDPRPRIIDSDLTIDWLLKFDLKFEMGNGALVSSIPYLYNACCYLCL